MEPQELYNKILLHFDAVVHRSDVMGRELRALLEELHSADIASFFLLLDDEESKALFLSFSRELQVEIFKEFSAPRQVIFLSYLDEPRLRSLLMELEIDELMAFFDELSDDELERYLKLLQKKDREQVLSLLQLEPHSAGRYMEVNVLALIADFTVEKSIQILRRIQPDQELHHWIFVTTRDGQLVGHILLEDLVLKYADTRLSSIVRENEFEILVDEDREEVAQKMRHYNITTAPVVDHKGTFLGIISADKLVDIIEEESSEDIYRMATMSPIKESYFDIPFSRLLYQRGVILVVLLFAQSFSSTIIAAYEVVLGSFLIRFVTMLASTGGNTSSQTSALAIQGLATGDINDQTLFRFVRRELLMASVIGLILGALAFARIYLWHENFWGSLTVSISLTAIVVISVTLGSCIPLVLKKLRLDPAHSAGPLLTTLMDIIGIFIYCVISSRIMR
ncbi:MAG: magnesium transporter [Candidatus Babeliaceae bacterium]|nr:magnesium transporter [Candidatus Babeliaceae bacterium]